MKIVIISGSSRAESVTQRVALAIQKTLTEKYNCHCNLIRLNEMEVPFIKDLTWNSESDLPKSLQYLWNEMNNAQAFVWVSPEYNGSYSSALKNFLDHFPKSTFSRKPVGIVTASPGAMGGIRAAMQMQQLICAFFAIPCPQMLTVGTVEQRFDALGNLVDANYEKPYLNFITEFYWIASRLAV